MTAEVSIQLSGRCAPAPGDGAKESGKIRASDTSEETPGGRSSGAIANASSPAT